MHLWLSEDVGDTMLAQHLYTIMMFQRLAIANKHGWNRFLHTVDQVLPRRGEAHLRRILGAYAAYYNESRIHRSLKKDAPFHRPIQRLGVITSQPVLGGPHHRYCRI
jgi:hypothetical protein